MAKLTDLRPTCRLAPGQTSRDCPAGTAGSIDGRLDEGDLDPDVLVRGFQARYQWLERRPSDYAGARAAQLRVLTPHLDSLNRAAALRKEDSHVCKCQTPDRVDIDLDDVDDGYDISGNPTTTTARRAAAAMFGQPSNYRNAPTASAPAREDADTDEDAAKRTLAARSANEWRTK